MMLIEGIGDEVIVTLGIGLAILLLILAWFSTHVSHLRWPTRVIVLRGHFATAAANGDQQQQHTINAEEIRDPSTAAEHAVLQHADDEVIVNSQGDEDDVIEQFPNMSEEASADAQDNAQRNVRLGDMLEDPPNPEPCELRNIRCNFYREQASTAQDIARSVQSNTPAQQTSGEVGESSSNDAAQRETVAVAPEHFDVGGLSESDSSRIRIRLRYLTENERLVLAYPRSTVISFKRQNFAEDLAANKLVRFIFNGQVLQDDRTLESYNIIDNTVVHTLISIADNHSQRNAAVQQSTESHEAFDAGSLMIPLFALILIVIWYLRFTYRQFFNITSTISLVFITTLFGACLYANHRRQRQQQQQAGTR